mmetsp:Transcript_37002/g.116404  ORF Transcript_37002/g.116404 Transcript_37002/m.116404 type:complete len:331 (-) Transcript_37002:743-1735(-)
MIGYDFIKGGEGEVGPEFELLLVERDLRLGALEHPRVEASRGQLGEVVDPREYDAGHGAVLVAAYGQQVGCRPMYRVLLFLRIFRLQQLGDLLICNGEGVHLAPQCLHLLLGILHGPDEVIFLRRHRLRLAARSLRFRHCRLELVVKDPELFEICRIFDAATEPPGFLFRFPHLALHFVDFMRFALQPLPEPAVLVFDAPLGGFHFLDRRQGLFELFLQQLHRSMVMVGFHFLLHYLHLRLEKVDLCRPPPLRPRHVLLYHRPQLLPGAPPALPGGQVPALSLRALLRVLQLSLHLLILLREVLAPGPPHVPLFRHHPQRAAFIYFHGIS